MSIEALTKLVNTKVKQVFGTQYNFAENYLKIKRGQFSSKLDTLHSKIEWINCFLKPLGLKIKIVEVSESET